MKSSFQKLWKKHVFEKEEDLDTLNAKEKKLKQKTKKRFCLSRILKNELKTNNLFGCGWVLYQAKTRFHIRYFY